MLCLNCNKNKAIKDPRMGWIVCKSCQNTQNLSDPIEIVPDHIKEDRKMMIKDIIQPFRDGHLSKEYVKLWGTKRLSVSQEEIDKSENVWDDISGYYKDNL